MSTKVGPKARDNQLANVAPRLDDNLPAHLREGESGSMTLLKQYVTPPRLKVIQRQTLPPLIEKFSPGDVIALPGDIMIAPVKMENNRTTGEGTPFALVPLFFYPEWVVWNPMEMKGVLPAIRSRTIDPRSPIAMRSKSPETWSEKIGDKDGKPIFARYVEHLNFVVKLLLPDDPLNGQFVTLSFARGEHRAGAAFCGLLQMRNAKHIYGCQFEACVGPRKKNENAWFGIDVMNPSSVDPWVQDKDQFDQYRLLHEGLAKTYAEGLLMAGYEDGEETPAETASAGSQSEY